MTQPTLAQGGLTYVRARELVAQLEAAGFRATADVRNVNPPCVLVLPPTRERTGFCGWDVSWQLLALVPGPDNLDAWAALDVMVDDLAQLLPITAARPTGFSKTGAEPSIPAYQLEMTEVLS